jgi:hypothetical protein
LTVKHSFIAQTVVFVLLVLASNAGCVAAADRVASEFSDEIRPISELYRLELLPRLNPGETCKMFSSCDRTGGNDDGFSGKYSILRAENGESVLAEMKGPGCIQRMHFPHSEYGVPGLLGRKGEHIRIYLDGETKPALDVPLEDIFYGKLEGFPKPVADTAIGGFYCYVPIPYKKSCKVAVASKVVRFVQVVYRTFPSDQGIATFQYPPTAPQRDAMAKAVKAWTSCGDLAALGVDEANRVETKFSLKAGESSAFALPDGPRMVRALCLKIKGEQIESADGERLEIIADAEGARLQITWDDAKSPAVDVPLPYFYCQAMKALAFRSLLVGTNERGWYNFMPMPYRKSGKVTIKAAKPLEGTLSFVTTPLTDNPDNLGYLHAVYNESLPTKTGVFHPYLKRQGRGRFIGIYLATDGQNESKMPTWLEGDEQFTCDGELRIHGTGTEDSFNAGWYAVPGRLSGRGITPLSGFPVYRRDNGRDVAVAYRWYLTDPVSYDKSLDAELEHGGTNDVNANYRTTAFFYDAAP